MSSKSLCFWVRCAIIVIAVCGICICAVWYPFSFALIEVSFFNMMPSELTSAQIWIVLIFFWLASVPCFFILFLCWKISTAIKKEEFFTLKAAKLIKLSAQILLIDLGVFLVGNIVFLLLNMNDFALFYFFLIIAGVILAIFISVLSHYVVQAADLKEVNEGTI